MRDDFAVFILTHGRADHIYTLNALLSAGYTGPYYFIVDNEDDQAQKYIKSFGQDKVITFDKKAAAHRQDFDIGDNFPGRDTVVYARNECFHIARQLGLNYFLQLDDDYTAFMHREIGEDGKLYGIYALNIDQVFEAMINFLDQSGALTVTFAQGGDFIGGAKSGTFHKGILRKAMNTFFCKTDRPFSFRGRLNDDVNTYVPLSQTGNLFFTYTGFQITQKTTQGQDGGLTDIYLDLGTYVKSFYSVMMAPSCVTVSEMGGNYRRIHHKIHWEAAAPKILPREVAGSLPHSSKNVSVIDKPPKALLQEYLQTAQGIDSSPHITELKEITTKLLEHYKGERENPLNLQKEWDNSGSINIYSSQEYLAEAFACYVTYSRVYLQEATKKRALNGKSIFDDLYEQDIESIADLGNGLGYTTAVLKEFFPKAAVYGTNLPGPQYKFAEKLSKKYNFTMKTDIQQIKHFIDLVIAFDYFEHFHEPGQHLEEIITKLQPKALLLANSFNTKASGHFDYYKINGQYIEAQKAPKAFNDYLRSFGYKKLKTKTWNSRPNYWKRGQENE